VYFVWFQDTSAEPEDQDFNWLACILITAECASYAREWGDHLARNYTLRNPENIFLRSGEITREDDPLWKGTTSENLPIVSYGVEASDAEIGW
jgi:hypothetical protein